MNPESGFLQFGFLSILLSLVSGTPWYYKTYQVFGSGDNIIQTLMAHGGPGANRVYQKWNVECLDGEAVIGILDAANDFTTLSQIWCKYLFGYKPPTNGIYPYYPNYFAKNMTTQFTCYSPRFHEPSVDSFIVGFWDNEFAFNIYRNVFDDIAPYKCCKAPTGYYIDYTSCYYQPTHDQYWEYYDAPTYFLVFCATGYVMTGLSKKFVTFSADNHLEWIQCCRLGFGAGPVVPPPPGVKISKHREDATSSPTRLAAAVLSFLNSSIAQTSMGRSLDDEDGERDSALLNGALSLVASHKGVKITTV